MKSRKETAPTDKLSTKETRFHDYAHALEYDRKAARSDIRAELALRLVEALALAGKETVLDLATGTGRFARPVAQRLKQGRIVGLDQAFAMLKVAREQKEPIPRYLQVAGVADSLPFRDCAFVSFAFHHFGRPSLAVVGQVSSVLKPGVRFMVVYPLLRDLLDDLDRWLNDRVNGIFRRSHGEHFRFHTAEEIKGLLQEGGLRVGRADIHSFAIDQSGTEGIPTGRHWLEAAEELKRESEPTQQRFRENYLASRREGETVRVRGSLSYALICGVKR